MAERVLVLEADRRQSIATIRSLGRRGISVTAGAEQRLSPGSVSRFVDQRLQYPSPESNTEAFVRALEGELRQYEYDVLLPITDVTVPPVVRHRGRLERYASIPYPSFETLINGLDKKRTVEAAEAAEVPVPQTIFPEGDLDPDSVRTEIGYPAVLKPRRDSGRTGVRICKSDSSLEAAYEELRDRYDSLLVQEFIPSTTERGVYTIYDCSSTLKGLTVQERIRSNPPAGGASTLRETIVDRELVDLATDLLEALEWSGVAMVEFRIDSRTGDPVVLEINPRLWGSLALSVHAGVDFPYLLYQLGTTGQCDEMLKYKVGVQARRLPGDIGHLLRRRDTVTALGEFLRSTDKNRTYDVISARDPLPGMVQLSSKSRVYLDSRLES